MQQNLALRVCPVFRRILATGFAILFAGLPGCQRHGTLADLGADLAGAGAADAAQAGIDASGADLLLPPDLAPRLLFQQLPFLPATYPLQAIGIGDIDLDGKPDIVIGDDGDGGDNVTTYAGTGDGTFASQPKLSVPGSGLEPVGLAIADFNGDGKPDLAIPSATVNDIGILLGQGDGTFKVPSRRYATGPGFGPAAGDLNGDGKPDLVLATTTVVGKDTLGTLVILLGQGDGTFNTVSHTVNAVPLNNAVLGDLNGDGKLDVVARGKDAVLVLLGDGAGGLGEPQTLPWPGVSDAIATGDLNGDGKLDIVALSPGNVTIWLGGGDGTLGPPATFPVQWTPVAKDIPYPTLPDSTVAIADFDGDGRPDVALARPDGVAILLGDGQGRLGAPYYVNGGAPFFVTFAVKDLNGDGKPDIVMLSRYTVEVLLNQPPR